MFLLFLCFSFTFFTLSFSFASAQDITSGLVGHWKFDEGSGTVAGDSSGLGNNGTLTNGPVWGVGKVGGALSFDGSDDYINLNTLNVSGSALTLSAWIRGDTFLPSDARVISKSIGTAEQDHYWMLSIIDNGGIKLRFRLKTNGTTNTLIASSGNLSPNTWYHVIARYDGSTMKLYLNGAEVGSTSKTGTLDTSNIVGVNIARNPDGYGKWDGLIDDVRIYNRALAQTDITALYNYTGVSDTEAPSMPTNLTATAQSSTQINLSWNASIDNVGVTGYKIYRCSGSGCTPITQITLSTSLGQFTQTYSDTGLSANTTYRYMIAAIDTTGNESPQSTIIQATTLALDTQAPSTPTGFSATAQSAIQTFLSWNASFDTGGSGLSHYELYRCQGTSCTPTTLVASPTGTIHADNSLTPETTYRYRVRSVDGAGNTSNYSNMQTATTPESNDPTTLPLLRLSDFVYEGGFKMPSGQYGSDGNSLFSYTDGAMAYDWDNNRFFTFGHTYGDYIAQVNNPGLGLATNPALLPTATVQQNFADVLNGVPIPAAIDTIVGIEYVNGTLIGNAMNYYDAGHTVPESLFVIANPDNLATTPVQGYYNSGYGSHTANWTSPIPAEWQPILGGHTHIAGGSSGWPIIGRLSVGPSLFTFNPSNLQSMTRWMDFNLTNPIHSDLSNTSLTNDLWTHLTKASYGFIVPGTRTYAVLGNSGGHNSGICYKCTNDQGTTYGGYGSYEAADNYWYYWLFDMSDIINAINPWDPRPYERGIFPKPINTSSNEMGNSSFDPTTNMVYAYLPRMLSGPTPGVIAYSFTIGGGSGDTTAPTVSLTQPINSATVSNTITILASAFDNIGISGVQFLLNGANLGAEDTTAPYSITWDTTTVTNGSYALTAEATDLVGNTMLSLSIPVTVNNLAVLPSACTPLPAPNNTVVNVSTVAQLRNAVANLNSNTTIMIASGTYNLTDTLFIPQGISNITFRSTTGNRSDVIIDGGTMTSGLNFGFWGDNISNITFADFTIRDFTEHAFIMNGRVEAPKWHNVRMIDIGDQFIKNNPLIVGTEGVDNGIVECSIMEYSTFAPDTYTNGVDVHSGKNWLIRNNTFRNIRTITGLAGPAILMWNTSQNTITENNVFLNTHRGISYGLIDQSGRADHSGGIIRNNFFYRSSSQSGDVGIHVADSPNTKVLNNTVILSGTYPNAIEYRYPQTTGTEVRYNLTDANITALNGATGIVSGNVTNAQSNWFVNPAIGNLHLTSSATLAINNALTHINVPTDYDGDTRPQGIMADVGADEYTGALQSLIGDINSDGTVNSLDWSIMSSQWFTSNTQSDLNTDGIVNSIDFSLMNGNWGRVR